MIVQELLDMKDSLPVMTLAPELEQLLHRFFAEACLNIDIEIVKGKRITPREWFVVPFEEIERAIELILKEQIVNYKYDRAIEKIVLK
jgi:hypothetical protein